MGEREVGPGRGRGRGGEVEAREVDDGRDGAGRVDEGLGEGGDRLGRVARQVVVEAQLQPKSVAVTRRKTDQNEGRTWTQTSGFKESMVSASRIAPRAWSNLPDRRSVAALMSHSWLSNRASLADRPTGGPGDVPASATVA